ncbi:UvrD-helicase domain-containing protein [Fulvivirga lutimaris]|uniref:UvrD-helicase domain-containing protein n=1 Tax=Fulvivirga lutimaris TaxID=1819566 RepID=UPI0012BC34D6|nr:UvrD-helicase domain-containing protein [Fulvivirga lutimaris]MTI41227.1 hypothetical protein [Fulvivirga lutimaris]
MLQKPFSIYRSSAGSGKTYTLAKSYLKLALMGKGKFRRILGVTFTNKATEEMKQRIIKFLTLLKADEEKGLTQELCAELDINESTLKRRSSEVLSEILHNYSRFSVVTIDSFFHQVIRSFAREMGLQGTFSIDLDTDSVMQQVIDRMLSEIGDDEHKEIKSWLTQYAEENVEEGESWDFRKDIGKLAKEVLKDNFKQFSDRIVGLADNPKQLLDIKKQLDVIQFDFENSIKSICLEAIQYIENKGLEIKSFSRGTGGPAGLFSKLLKFEWEITDPRRAAADNFDAWITKTNTQRDFLEQVLGDFILPKYNELIDFFDNNFIHYQSALEVKRYFYTFGILSYINKYLQVYRDENDVMLISDLPDFLNKIISDSDTPYIYEKVGSRFDNYLIDEFQDTSSYQWNNFKPLVKNATDQGQFCMVVGDAKQSIYRFRGGDWKLLQHQVKHDIGEVLTIENNLDTNWRSSANVIDFNNDIFERLKPLIQHTYIDNPSELIAAKMEEVLGSFNESFQKLPEHKAKDQGLVELKFIEVERGAEEGFKDLSIEYTIQKVEELQQAGYELRDIAILTRTTQEGKNIARAFIEHSTSEKAIAGLRYDVVSKEALYLTTSHVVQFIISVIKWLHDEKNKIELAHWFSTYLKYLKKSVDDESELYFQLNNWAENVPTDFVKLRHQLKSLPLYELVEELCRIFELSKVKEEYTYLQGFQDAVLEYSKNERGDIAAFLIWWEDVRKNRSIIVSDENNAVKVLTIHKSKGLEFPVVIIPFLSWSLDKQNNAVDSIMWCETIDKPPFNLMPMVPLKYATALQNTYWADEYHHEKLKNLLDNLNVLYVAVTRPESALYITAPKGKEGSLGRVNELLYSLVKGQEQWDVETQKYTLGRLPDPIKSGRKSNEVTLKDYSSHSWRSKVRLQMRDSANQNKEHFNEAAAYGIKLHDALSKIRNADQIDQFKEHPLFSDLNKTVLALSEYFDKSWEIRTEVPVLLPNGDMRRIDRLNQRDNKVVLIDYKTGSERDKDKSQMQEYMRLVSQMIKKPVEGLLFYLESQEILKVEGGQHEA